jgi:hypothetical protein
MGAYLSHGAFSTPTEAKKFTISFWFKRSELGAVNYLLGAYDGSSTNSSDFVFGTGDNLALYFGGNAGSGYLLQTNRVFRDTNAWYHFVYEVDTTQATDSNRVKVYINGVQETSFSTEQYPPQNATTFIFNSANNKIGQQWDASTAANSWDGSMAHFHFIDGTAYDASAFGQTETSSGIWKPKTSPSVTYGTNGFFLKFGNAGSLGTDSSGNGNNFTVNGTGTQTLDTPSNVFATLNAVDYAGGATYSLGNTRVLIGSTALRSCRSTLGMGAGKYYWEVKLTAQGGSLDRWRVGITNRGSRNEAEASGFNLGNGAYEYAWNVDNGDIINNNSGVATYSTCTTNDICSLALDLDNNKLYFAKNGTWENSADPSAGTGGLSITDVTSINEDGAYFFAVGKNDGTFTYTLDCNFGNGYFGTTAVSTPESDTAGLGQFEYSVPSGYYALCTKNIAEHG